ncbi:hypothetical protein GIB67_030935 [Kingdonia uniflora]|uniref:Uncharacterized protein n=1 Tax=Kingdonia uniflora TaxID=39325 RepID=A0A7J7L3G5_9MAGN|nr:hypothetical protein GIB67_030935 [Kingdonia uniflora]
MLMLMVSNQEAIDTASLARSRLCTLGSTGDGWIDENKFGSENKSPPSKSQRLLSVMQHKMNSSSPTSGVKEDKDGLCCLNITPLKSCDILFGEQQIKNIKFPIHEPTSGEEKDGDFFFCESTKSPSKSRRISLVKQHKQKKTNFTTQENNSAYTKKLTLSGKEDEYEFCCENTSPSKTWETSLVNQQTVTPKFPNQECNNYPKKTTSGWNVAACKDLVNLAASRGSLDDITVMIIDLEHFRCNSQSQ